jgi:hypothetical protein
MTAQEQDLIRIKSWDNYVEAKKRFYACRDQLEHWGKTLEVLGRKLENHPVSVIAQEFNAIPSREVFAKGVEDFRAAGTDYKRAWVSAKNHGFPVGEHDLNELGGA